ncbi:hypothetical protein ISS06_02950 [Patescibacteria group bacterium]|nr:hypothetical protein [Patescibacteria group bacterium]
MSIKKIIFFSVACLSFLFFIFFTYFYCPPDDLIELAGDKIFFYLHLNLNKFNHSGRITNKWIASKNIDNVLKELGKSDSVFNIIGKNINKENLPLLDQASIFLLNSDKNNLGVILLLKTKKNASSLEVFKKNKKITKNIILIESEKGIYKKLKQVNKNTKNNLLNFFVIGKGFLNVNKLKDNPDNGFGGFVDFSLMHSLNNFSIKELLNTYKDIVPEKLCFIINSFDSDIYSNSFDLPFMLRNDVRKSFVIIFPKQITLDHLIKKARAQLAYNFPIKKKVVLPDNSIFIEKITEPTNFEFKTIKKDFNKFYYWQDTENVKRAEDVIFSETEEHVLLSNDFSFLEKIISSNLLRETDINKAVILEIEEFNISKLIIKESQDNGFSGCFVFQN